MPPFQLDHRFLDTTRGRLLTVLRRGPCSVDDLARAIGLTDNAVRAHLTTLERDGLVVARGSRRTAAAGKPATLYEVHRDAEAVLSRAYAPALAALVDELVSELPTAQSAALLDGLGRRLAAASPPPPADAAPAARIDAAVGALRALGGIVELEERDGKPVIRGFGCPLGVAVARRSEACRAVESMLREITGADVRQCCTHGDRPSCCFEVTPAA